MAQIMAVRKPYGLFGSEYLGRSLDYISERDYTVQT